MGFCSLSTEFKKTGITYVDNSFIYGYLPEADGVAVKVYLAGLAVTKNSAELSAEEFAKSINVTSEELYDSFVYWEQYDLVKIISHNPLLVRYEPIPALVNKPKKYKPEKYSDFTKTVQSLIPERMISVNEYSNYFSIMEENRILPDAMILIIKYCVDLKGNDIGYRYILKVINDFISRGLTTFESIDNELSQYVTNSNEVNSVLVALGIKRKPEISDVKLFEKWTKHFGFSLESILFAVSKIKKGKIDKLDDFLTELFTYKLFAKAEIENYISQKEKLHELTIKINKTISVYYEVLEPEIETYTSVWTNLGYSEQSLLFLASYCFKSNKRTIASLDDLIKKLYSQGIVSFESIVAYFEEINAQNEFILKMFDIVGISRQPIEWDRENLKNWRSWGFSDEMIIFACKNSCGKNNPFSYVSSLLSDYKNKNLFTIESVENCVKTQTKQTKSFENQREYSQEYFDSLITKVATTKI